MTNITVNSKSKTIELTKKFSKAASRYGSPEYIELQNARKDYPDYRVETKAGCRKAKESYKGLTYEYMEAYIEAHDDEDKTTMAEFKMLRATSEEAKAFNAVSASYHEIREWFFKKYPAFAAFQKKREELLAA